MGGGGVAPGLQRATLHRSTHTVQFPVTARDSEYFQQDINVTIRLSFVYVVL